MASISLLGVSIHCIFAAVGNEKGLPRLRRNYTFEYRSKLFLIIDVERGYVLFTPASRIAYSCAADHR